MAKRPYSFLPGCSFRPGASASHALRSVQTVCAELDLQLETIPDWNCCGASLGHVGGGELPRIALSARNLALSAQAHPGRDLVTACPGCWLATREASERLRQDEDLLRDAREALAAGGLRVRAEPRVRRLAEVLVEDVGYAEIAAHVRRPLDGIRIAGYVGCQSSRPVGVAGDSTENPQFLDRLVEALGGESIPAYEKKVQCCGGALALSEPARSEGLLRGILEAARDHRADLIVTPCSLCQLNLEVYQRRLARSSGARPGVPVVFYTSLMAAAFGHSPRQAGLDGQLVPALTLQALAETRGAG